MDNRPFFTDDEEVDGQQVIRIGRVYLSVGMWVSLLILVEVGLIIMLGVGMGTNNPWLWAPSGAILGGVLLWATIYGIYRVIKNFIHINKKELH